MFEFPQLGLASAIAAGVGVAGALAAAAAGLADWMDIDPPDKAIGAFHATVNVSATILFLVSFLIRWRHHWETGWEPLVVALAGYLFAMIGGYLGGALVFYKGVMINRNAYRIGPDEFKPVVATRDLEEGQMKRVLVEEQPLLLLKLGGTVYAFSAVCSHHGAPLNQGKIVERTIECPWHASRFALEDGRVAKAQPAPACLFTIARLPTIRCRSNSGNRPSFKPNKNRDNTPRDSTGERLKVSLPFNPDVCCWLHSRRTLHPLIPKYPRYHRPIVLRPTPV